MIPETPPAHRDPHTTSWENHPILHKPNHRLTFESQADLTSVPPEDIIQSQFASAHQIDKTPLLPLNFRMVQANPPFNTHTTTDPVDVALSRTRGGRGGGGEGEGGSQPLQSEGEQKQKKQRPEFLCFFCFFGRSLPNSNFISVSSTFSVSSH